MAVIDSVKIQVIDLGTNQALEEYDIRQASAVSGSTAEVFGGVKKFIEAKDNQAFGLRLTLLKGFKWYSANRLYVSIKIDDGTAFNTTWTFGKRDFSRTPSNEPTSDFDKFLTCIGGISKHITPVFTPFSLGE